MRAIANFVTGRRTAWITLLGCIIALGLVFALVPQPAPASASTPGLSSSADSQRVADLLAAFPTANTTAGIVVWNRVDGRRLTSADQSAIVGQVNALAALTTEPQDVRAQISVDRTAMAAAVLVREPAVAKDAVGVANSLRGAARTGLPNDLEARLTGDVATAADSQTATAGTDLRLLLILGIALAVLLILFTRSVVVWIVPVVVIGAAEWLTRIVAGAVDSALGIPLTAATGATVTVVVVGVGAGLSLLLLVRYREESRGTDDRHVAMRDALGKVRAAVAASAATMALGLLALSFSALTATRALGVASAIGIVIAAVFVLILLPSTLVVFPRGVFWLPTPRFADPSSTAADPRSRYAETIENRRTPLAIVAVVVVGVFALGLIGAQLGGSQQVGDSESSQAQRFVDHAYGPGYGNQAIMLVPDSLRGQTSVVSPTTLAINQDVVHSVTKGESHDGRTKLVVALTADAGSPQAIATIRALRKSIARAGGPTATTLIGGPDAVAIDTRAAAAADRSTVIPILLGVLLLVLILLMRALLGPVLLVAGSAAAFFGGLGLANLIFTRILGYPTIDSTVVVPAFALVVALGVGYSAVFLLRAHAGLRAAISPVGGVLIGAGIIVVVGFGALAFAIPVVAVIQLGVIVGTGVLLDALVVRALLLPSLGFLLDSHFWWPRRAEAAK